MRKSPLRKFERENLIKEILNLVGQGLTRTEIIKHVMKNAGFCRRHAIRYVDAASMSLVKMVSRRDIETILLRYEYLYRTSIESGDMKLAKQILDSVSKLVHGETIHIEEFKAKFDE